MQEKLSVEHVLRTLVETLGKKVGRSGSVPALPLRNIKEIPFGGDPQLDEHLVQVDQRRRETFKKTFDLRVR
jgi:hypothetical protein